MKKFALVVACLMFAVTIYAQENQKVEITKKGDLTEATYYYDNGKIEQMGTFNADGKLHGTWTSFDQEGNKVAIGSYENGLKVGKWFFWTDDILKEVDYLDSKIISVNQWTDKTRVAIRN